MIEKEAALIVLTGVAAAVPLICFVWWFLAILVGPEQYKEPRDLREGLALTRILSSRGATDLAGGMCHYLVGMRELSQTWVTLSNMSRLVLIIGSPAVALMAFIAPSTVELGSLPNFIEVLLMSSIYTVFTGSIWLVARIKCMKSLVVA